MARGGFGAQDGGAGLHGLAVDLGHPRGGRAFAGREREDVDVGEAAVFDDAAGVLEHFVRFGREAGDDVGADRDVRPPRADGVAEGERIVAQVAALHALQHHVVAGLEREVEVRHQARLAGDEVQQFVVHLDAVDGRKAEARKAPAPASGCGRPARRGAARPEGRRRSW